MPNFLLDTNILILALRKHDPTLDLLDNLQQQGILHISVITRAEVLAGMHPHEEARTLSLLQPLDCLPVESAVADQAGRWVYQYARKGIQLSIPDALIGATAAQYELTLVTTNASHFPMPEISLHTMQR